VALLLVVFPGGIGAREVLLVTALAPALSSGPALAIALAARLVTTVSDLTWGGIGLALARRMRRTAEPAVLSYATQHSAVQHSAVQHSAVQHSVVQHSVGRSHGGRHRKTIGAPGA
jgi:hypothetical protein